MSEMIERVADALSEHWLLEHETRADVAWLAFIAIEAMREPTRGMMEVGEREVLCSPEAWRAMIDAALKREPPTQPEPTFGSASMLCDGSGDYITTPDNADFVIGSADFTIKPLSS